MFEELNNQAAPISASPASADEIPAVAPILAPTPVNDPEVAVQDIFANVESPVPATPANNQPFGQPNIPMNTPLSNQFSGQPEKKPGSAAKLILIVLAVLIVAAIGVLAYLQYFKKTPPAIVTPEPINNEASLLVTSTDTTATPTEAIITEPTSTETVSSTDNVIGGTEIMESSTTSNSSDITVTEAATSEANTTLDSDKDGLTDAEELNIYQTNPLKADSDGDGYTDGDEVKAGYNPLGEGKLVQ